MKRYKEKEERLNKKKEDPRHLFQGLSTSLVRWQCCYEDMRQCYYIISMENVFLERRRKKKQLQCKTALSQIFFFFLNPQSPVFPCLPSKWFFNKTRSKFFVAVLVDQFNLKVWHRCNNFLLYHKKKKKNSQRLLVRYFPDIFLITSSWKGPQRAYKVGTGSHC